MRNNLPVKCSDSAENLITLASEVSLIFGFKAQYGAFNPNVEVNAVTVLSFVESMDKGPDLRGAICGKHGIDPDTQVTVMVWNTAWPSRFDKAIIARVSRGFKPGFIKPLVERGELAGARARGGESCTYVIE